MGKLIRTLKIRADKVIARNIGVILNQDFKVQVIFNYVIAADIEQLSRFSSIGYCDDSTIVYLQHPCIILTALEVLGYKVVASSSTSIKQDYNEYMWTMRKEFSEPEPDIRTVIKEASEPVVKAAGMARNFVYTATSRAPDITRHKCDVH